METKYKAETIVVNNNFQARDIIPWLSAMSSCSPDSIVFFDKRKRLIYYNNKYGTLDNCSHDDLLDIYSLFGYYGRFYQNSSECLGNVKKVFETQYPVHFIMEHKEGWSCNCKACPVLDNGGLGGVVLLAHRVEDGPELQGRGGNSGKLRQPARPKTEAPVTHSIFSRVLARITSGTILSFIFHVHPCVGP